MRQKLFNFQLVLPVFFFIACGSPGNDAIYEGLDYDTRTKMKKYYIQGKLLYATHCSNCHGEDGKGLGNLIPPLAQSDFLIENKEQIACLVKFGQTGEITVNGVNYNQPMPENRTLTDLEIAEIITFVGNTWSNRVGFIDVKTTRSALQKCK